MKIYKCVVKSRMKIEKEIPRDRWGWWADICPGQTLELRAATQSDLDRCSRQTGDNRPVEAFLCELGPHGSLVSIEAIGYVKMLPENVQFDE